MAVLLLAAAGATASGAEGQRRHTFSDAAGGERGYFLASSQRMTAGSAPALVVVFAGTSVSGREMHEWFGRGWRPGLGLEDALDNAIFVYPDQKFRWGGDGGWELGPQAGDYGGERDLTFVSELLDLVGNEFKVDPQRIFVTGHSWGGDMAAVAACLMGDRIRAAAPIAANRPYWFGEPPSSAACKGQPGVWTIFGLEDDHFGDASPDGAFGQEQNAFWLRQNKCAVSGEANGATVDYADCAAPVRLTLYEPGQYTGGGGLPAHQPPDWIPEAIAKWFSNF